jgi:malonyl-CoA O-methyltransferase
MEYETLPKKAIASAFSKSAADYDQVAHLQQEVGRRLIEEMGIFRITPRRILDLGCGTGQMGRALSPIYNKSQLIYADLALGMVQHNRNTLSFWQRRRSQFLCSDAEKLPLADGSNDLIVSNLAFQWCRDLETLFSECQRVLSPNGLLLFTTLGPDTLKELRYSWQQVDNTPHINEFIDMHDVGDAMQASGLDVPVLDMEHLTVPYRQSIELMRELKILGAHSIQQGRQQGLTSPSRLRQVNKAYEQFRGDDGLLPATYEVIYGHAWKGQPRPDQPSEFLFDPTQIAPFTSGKIDS